MNNQQSHQLGLSQCQIAERLDLDRKTVRRGEANDWVGTRRPRVKPTKLAAGLSGAAEVINIEQTEPACPITIGLCSVTR